MTRKIVVTTPVHNRKEETLLCLKSIFRSNLENLEVEVVVVDDGSTDGTSEAVLSSFPQVRILKGDGDLWYTGGINVGIQEALKSKPDYILTINNDSVFDEQCIRRMVSCAERYPHSVIGALLLNREQPHRVFQVAPEWNTWLGGIAHFHNQTVWTVPACPWEVDIIVGNCVLYPVETIYQAGLMDENRLAQFGDAEYTPRMRKLGWRLIVEPRARVFCKPNDLVTGFRRFGFRKKLQELLMNPHSSYSVRRKIVSNLANAPDVFQGLASILIFYFRVLIGKNVEGNWGRNRPEKPLAETQSLRVVGHRGRIGRP
jgi:GT2 family glycosyltransferase